MKIKRQPLWLSFFLREEPLSFLRMNLQKIHKINAKAVKKEKKL